MRYPLMHAPSAPPSPSCRSWIARGNAIVNNTFIRIRNTVGFNLGWGEVNAVYLDDQLSQQYVVGNRILDSDTGILVNGGRDVVVSANSFENCTLGVRFANPGMTVQTDCALGAPNAHRKAGPPPIVPQ